MAGPIVATGAMALCTMGMAPSTLNFIPAPVVMGPTQAGKVTDMVPMLNIPLLVCALALPTPLLQQQQPPHWCINAHALHPSTCWTLGTRIKFCSFGGATYS